MKKILTVSIIAALLTASVNVGAAKIESVVVTDFDNSIMTVTGTIDNEKDVAIAIVKKGENLAPGEYAGDNVTVQKAVIDGNKFTATFKFAPENGTYTAFASNDSGMDFEYVKKETVLQFIDDLANGKIAEKDIYEDLEYYGASAGIDISFVKSQSDKDYVAKNMIQYADRIKEGGLSSVVAVAELTKNELSFMNELKNAPVYSTVDGLFNKYEDSAEINLDEYKKLANAKKQAVATAFVEKSYSDMAAFRKAFEKAVADAKNAAQTPGGGGSGSGSGSSDKKGNSNATMPSMTTGNAAMILSSDNNPGGEAVKLFEYYKDVENCSWAWDAILYMHENNIMTGVGDENFAPDVKLTREQFAKIITLAFKYYDENSVSDYEDVPSNSWAGSYVASAKKNGLMNGIDENNFGFGRQISRQDLCVVIYRAALKAGFSFNGTKSDFADFDSVSDYAKEAVSKLAGSKIISGMGDNTFAPFESATRAQAAKLVYAIIGG